MRSIIFGNAGSGKSTLARRLIAERAAALLALDQIAWANTRRKAFEESLHDLQRFLLRHELWIIEGCYGDLIEAALPYCTELIFLNPGVDACIANCRNRPWEPEKFGSPGAQRQMLEQLIEWVRQYDTREDEYGLKRHRRIFESFAGTKREYQASDAGV